MISLEEALRAYHSKTPVFYDHPLSTKPIVCTVGGIEFSKHSGRLRRIVLVQPPSKNSYIRTRPEYVSMLEKTEEEKI